MQALEDAEIDIAFMTETWLEEHSGDIVGRIKEYSFNIHRQTEEVEEAELQCFTGT